MRHHASRLACAVLALAAGHASAQAGVAWVTFSQQPGRLGPGVAALSDPSTDIDFATGDLDQDGWPDVVAVGKEPAGNIGKGTDTLLMNEAGVLTDETLAYATASDLPGSQGFLDLTHHMAVKIADLDADGWLDVVMAAALCDGAPKFISHPRVYRNLGIDGGGQWLGLRFEDGRIPQLFTAGGLAVAPRFSQVAVGDLTGDGAPDLYFTDFDSTEENVVEPANWDLNDRLLVNDGSGYFSDQSSARFTNAQLLSSFGTDAQVVDLNADGLQDIVKVTYLTVPIGVKAVYNDPASVGLFQASGQQSLNGFTAAQGLAFGNLNNDALPDLVVVDCNADGDQLGTGYDGSQHLQLGPKKVFTFVTGADDGFGRHVEIADLDGNGWNDVIITDVDVDLPGCNRRLHVYHNTGSVAGDMNVALKEESQLVNGGSGSGWKGVVGMSAADERGTYAVAIADFDLDGDLDLLQASCTGTRYWQNETIQSLCQSSLGFGGPGSLALSLCGADLTQAGSIATLEVSGALPGQAIFVPLSLTSTPVPFKGGTLVPFPVLTIVNGLSAGAGGSFSAPVAGSAGTPVHLYMQCITTNAGTFKFSNALDVVIGI